MAAPNSLQWLSDYVLGDKFQEDSGLKFGGRVKRDQQADFGLTSLMHELFGARDQENARYSSGLGKLMAEFQQGTQDFKATDAALRQQTFSRESDRIHDTTAANMKGLRGALGGSGLGFNSGAAMGVASQINVARLGQLTGTKRDVAIDSANRRLLHNNQRFQKMMGIAQFENQSPSLLGADAIRSAIDVRVGQSANATQREAAKDASNNALTGGLIQGGLGLLSGAL